MNQFARTTNYAFLNVFESHCFENACQQFLPIMSIIGNRAKAAYSTVSRKAIKHHSIFNSVSNAAMWLFHNQPIDFTN